MRCAWHCPSFFGRPARSAGQSSRMAGAPSWHRNPKQFLLCHKFYHMCFIILFSKGKASKQDVENHKQISCSLRLRWSHNMTYVPNQGDSFHNTTPELETHFQFRVTFFSTCRIFITKKTKWQWPLWTFLSQESTLPPPEWSNRDPKTWHTGSFGWPGSAQLRPPAVGSAWAH